MADGEPSWKKRTIFWSTIVATVAAVVGTIAAIIPLIHGDSADKGAQQSFVVTSNNQIGGITAGIVNLGAPQRKLDDATKRDILQHLPNDTTIQVCSVADGEAHAFAEEIYAFIQSSGYRLGDAICTTFPNEGGPRSGLEYDAAVESFFDVNVLYRPK